MPVVNKTQKALYLVEPRGFCSGVKNALQIIEEVLQTSKDCKVFVFNEIVHNKTIVEDLKNRGVNFVQATKKIPHDSLVVFSAHGVPPQTRTELHEKKINFIDATCPLVKKVHDEVNHYSKLGYHVIYIGDAKHDEAKGVIAENPRNISVVTSPADIKKIKKGFTKYIVLNQTTLNMFEVNDLVSLIKLKLPGIKLPKKADLCFTTTSRQIAVSKVLPNCELLLVVGSKNSSNSQMLKQIALKVNKKAQLIDSCWDIKPIWLKDVTRIALTAGASAPEYLVEEAVEFLEQKGYKITT
ncbi:MAG: 4-hydroxy-3-methylbut-2-enyl diphosphate reductase [Candidatus Margulisiibacteriota bacterium]|jgi:4-hydroxy-3-methylbut-2-enyl diphosphate reductase